MKKTANQKRLEEYKRKIKPKSKFGAKKTKYKDRTYDSKFEAEYARSLDWKLKSKKITEVIPQFKIPITVNGIHITNYFMDFKVVFPNGSIEMHEVKGMETQVWKLKWKLAKALYPEYKFILIKRDGI